MEKYCQAQAKSAELMLEFGLDQEARIIVCDLLRCAALSDCGRWQDCARRATQMKSLMKGGAVAC